jgi:hypothetical protein
MPGIRGVRKPMSVRVVRRIGHCATARFAFMEDQSAIAPMDTIRGNWNAVI